MQKLLLKHKEKCQVVDIDHIVFCESSNNYSTFYLCDGTKVVLSKCLTQVAKDLNGNFIRISQSFLVNLDHIEEIISSKKLVRVTSGKLLNFTMKYHELCNVLESKFGLNQN